MFFLLVIAATCFYSLQSTLMVSYYRRIDPLFGISLRGIAIGVVMLPLLLAVPPEKFLAALEYYPIIIGSAVVLTFANWARAWAYCLLPVGIVAAVCCSVSALILIAIGRVFLGDILTSGEILWICALLLSVSLLGASRSRKIEGLRINVPKGLLLCLAAGGLSGVSYCLLASASRSSHPFLVGLIWELLAGITGALIVYARSCLFSTSGSILDSLARRDFFRIILFCSPAALGTACYAYGITLGAVAVASAILSTTMVGTAILSHYLYKEKLTAMQWGLMSLVLVCLIGIKLTAS